jgi:hypothetical protein
MPDFATANACFNNLLHTANKASFLLFPLATIRSYRALQALLYLQALKRPLKLNVSFNAEKTRYRK